jgi:subtilisin family serine protease
MKPVFLAAAVLTASAGIAAHADGPEFEPGVVLVRLSPGSLVSDINNDFGTSLLPGNAVPSRDIYLLSLPAGESESTYVGLLSDDPRIVSADFNYYSSDINPAGSTRRMYLSVRREEYDADPVPAALALPDALKASQGAGVVIAVLDTGIDRTHPLLAGRVAPGGFNFLSNSTDTSDLPAGLDTDQDGLPDELAGHGTIVSGLALRVAPGARLLPIKVMDSDGYSTAFRLAQGVYHAIDLRAGVINISMGMTADTPVLREAINAASRAGVIVVAAAGNADTSAPDFPAGYASALVLAVAATDSSGSRAAFSNYGEWISLAAPGLNLVSTTPGGGFGLASGTSLSAPLVAGTAALVRALCPLASPKTAVTHVLSRGLPIDALNPGYEGLLGAGSVHAGRALGRSGTPALPCDCDRNDDLRIDLTDVRLLTRNPSDVNDDGYANLADADDLKRWLISPRRR